MRATAALTLAKINDFNQWVPGSSPGAPTTQSSETQAVETTCRKAAFAAISRESLAGDFRSLCGDIVSRALFVAPVSGSKNRVPNSNWAG